MILPKLNIPTTPLICAYIKHDWNEVETFEEATNFVHKWLNNYETSQKRSKKTSNKTMGIPHLLNTN